MKTYTIIEYCTRRNIPTETEFRSVTGTVSELVDAFKDNLEEGLSDYEHKRHQSSRAYKISLNPKSIKALINALNKSNDNRRYYNHDGPILEKYKLVEL